MRLRTPYTTDVTALAKNYLERNGFSVSSAEGLGLRHDRDIAAVDEEQLIRMVTGDDNADVVMLSCTNLPAIYALDRLAAQAGLPVVTSNLAAADAVKRVLEGSLRPLAQPSDG